MSNLCTASLIRLLATVIAATSFSIATSANELNVTVEQRDWALNRVRAIKGRKVELERQFKNLTREFSRLNIDGGELDERDFELAAKQAVALIYASTVATFLLLDLDLDGSLTKDEWSLSSITNGATKLVQHKFSDLDTNSDNVIAMNELRGVAKARAEQSAIAGISLRGVNSARQAFPQLLDLDGSGGIHADEWEKVLRTVFQEFDVDNDGVLSDGEVLTIIEAQGQARQRTVARLGDQLAEESKIARRLACKGIKPVSTQNQFILVQADNGNAFSTVALDNQSVVTTVGQFHIEPGEGRIDVLVSTHSALILRLSGAVERIDRFIVSGEAIDKSGNVLAAVEGLRPDQVEFLNANKCMINSIIRTHNTPGTSGARVISKVFTTAFGKPFDKLLSVYQGRGKNSVNLGLSTMFLPSGNNGARDKFRDQWALPPQGPSAWLWKSHKVLHPGGVVEIDPKRLITEVKLIKYETLPYTAAAPQLIDNGSLEPVLFRHGVQLPPRRYGDQFVRSFAIGPKGSFADEIAKGGTAFKAARGFRIKKRFRYPGPYMSVFGTADPIFYLPEGVPMPTGQLTHACIFAEKTGERLVGNCKKR